MKITADTNVLLRAVLPDDDAQRKTAIDVLSAAEAVAVSVHCLCEFAWVLERRYKAPRADIAEAIQRLIDTRNVLVDRPAVEAGLSALQAGGDFADGVIAYDGVGWAVRPSFLSTGRRSSSSGTPGCRHFC